MKASIALFDVAEAVAVDEAEVVPEVELEVRVARLPSRAVEHLAERALELLPVLLRGEDLVDALEGLEVARVEIERLVEQLDRAILVVHLVAVELRHREDVTWPCARVLLHVGDALDACRPSAPSSAVAW